MALLGPLSQEPEFAWTCGFHRKLERHKFFHFQTFPDKTNDSIFLESLKTLFLGHF